MGFKYWNVIHRVEIKFLLNFASLSHSNIQLGPVCFTAIGMQYMTKNNV